MSRYGNSFERSAILQWLNKGHGVCPLSRRPLCLHDLVTNHALRMKIAQWQMENGQENVVVLKPNKNQQVYGFITLPVKDDEDITDRTVDEEDDLVYIDMDRLRRQQARILETNNGSRRRRHHRRHSTGSGNHQRTPRAFRGLRKLFTNRAA